MGRARGGAKGTQVGLTSFIALGARVRVWALLLAGLAACGSSNTLAGSIATYKDLSFQTLSITATAESLIISYVRQPGSQQPAKLVVQATASPNLAKNLPLNLSNDAFTTGVTLTRVMTKTDPKALDDVFPKLVSGSLVLDNASLTSGSLVSGHFAVTFDKDDDQKIATGYELYGTFSGKID